MDVAIGVSGVNLRRTMERIERLAHVSAGSGPGVTRLPFTAAWEQANMLVRQWMEEAGMLVRRDEVGNLIGRYEGALAGAPVLSNKDRSSNIRTSRAGWLQGSLEQRGTCSAWKGYPVTSGLSRCRSGTMR
jgi:hypothetical protein